MKAKKLLWVVIPVILLSIWHYRELIHYGWMQGKGQLNVILAAKPVEEALNDPALPDSLKSKLHLLRTIVDFADSLGLEVNESYLSVYDQQGKPILWNVSACQPYAFQSYQWTFPFLGTFSYKGFFDKDAADQLVLELKDQGYDVNIRTVGAWSTLGWFDDPLLSNQLYRPVGSFAETVFHELTHATIFFKDSLAYNENLATYIGEQAADRFLVQHFGPDSPKRKQYIESEEDAGLYRTYMLAGKEQLDSLYQSFDNQQSDQEKQQLKQQILEKIIAGLDTVGFNNQRYTTIFSRGRELNNAYLMGFSRYYSQQSQLDSMLVAYDNDLVAWIQALKTTSN